MKRQSKVVTQQTDVLYKGYWICQYTRVSESDGYYIEKDKFCVLNYAESVAYAKSVIDGLVDLPEGVSMKVSEMTRDSDNKLPAYAWPGGYPIVYADKDNSILCADCATKSLDDKDEIPAFKPISGDVYWEGPTMQCDQCNKDIESAYGDPQASDVNNFTTDLTGE